METHLTYDNKGRQLGILFRERLTTDQNVQLKVLGVLNTVTGHIETCAKLRKFFGVPKPRARVAATLPKNYLQSLRQQGRVGVGLTYLSGTDDILAGMVAQKSFFLGPPRSPLELKLKAHADYNTQTQQVDGLGRAQLSKTVYGFTDMQDLRVVLGCKAHVDQTGAVTPAPYGRLQENNWSLFYDFKGFWGVRYDL